MSNFSQCFDNVAQFFMGCGNLVSRNIVVCHGIVEAKKRGSEGITGHAWVELDSKVTNGRDAVDPTAKLTIDAHIYRSEMKARNIITYRPEEFIYHWWRFGYPGPWDAEIKKVTKNGS